MEDVAEATTAETGEEEVDLNTLQQGLAKAMVLQWKSTHPDQNIDEIISTITKASGQYHETLAEQGINKTLYDQWRFVKFKSKATASSGARKAMTITLPDRSSRPTRESVALKEGLQIEMSKKVVLEEGQSPITQQSPKREVCSSFEFVSKEHEENEADSSVGSGMRNGDVAGATDMGVEATSPTEKSPRKAVQKTEVDMASYKAKIAQLKQNRETANKKKENVPTIEKVELEKKDLELDGPKSHGLNGIDPLKQTNTDVSAEVPKPLDSLESEVKQEDSNRSKIEQLKKNMAKFAKEKEEAKILEEQTEKVSFPTSEKSINLCKSQEREEINDKNALILAPKDVSVSNSLEIEKALKTENVSDIKNKANENMSNTMKEIKKEEKKEIKSEGEEMKGIKTEGEEMKGRIEKGSAKNIMNKLLSDSQTKVIEKRIKLIIDDSVPESPDKAEEEEEKESATETARKVVKEGSAKQLLDKWKSNEITRSSNDSRVRVEVKEEDGKVSENVPEVKEGVVRAEEGGDVVTVEKGATKNLLTQWQNKPLNSAVLKKKQIVVLEDDGKVSENEPLSRDDVVRNSDAGDETTVEKGITKNLLHNWQNRKENETVKRKIEINEEDGRCVESEPVQNPGVVRAVDKVDYDVNVTRGKTSQLLGQWQQQNSIGSGGSSRDKTPFMVSETDGKVAENQPMMVDMAREGDGQDGSLVAVQKGMAKDLKAQWQNMDQDRNYKKENRVVISEDDGKVVENEPTQLEDVARESEIPKDTHVVNKGQTSGLLKKWQSETPVNQQERKVLDVKGGMTQSLLSQWTLKGSEEFKGNSKEIILNEGDGCVAENTPEERGFGVVKSGKGGEETRGLVGQTRKAKELLLSSTYESKREPTKLWDDSTTAQSVSENDPEQRSDVCREEDSILEVVASKGFARNIVGRWGQDKGRGGKKEVRLEYADGPAVFENEPAPSLKYDKQLTKSSGVFENQPDFRDDVTREVDMTPEVIPANVTRNAKKLWFQKEKDAANNFNAPRRVEMVRFTPERERSQPS